jgi:1-acyl-sn-glycerol-3-phosphate acyltransferase
MRILFGSKIFNTNLNLYIMLYYLCGIKHNIKREKIIDKGYILCNHRSFFDFYIDPYISNSTILGRNEAVLSVSFMSLLAYLDNKIISFSRGNTSRKKLFNIIKKHIKNTNFKRILFYPEGTRRSHKTLSSLTDVKNKFKLGLLKSIYECPDKLPVQICLSSNKEYIFNQKKFSCKYGMEVNTELSDAIYPSDFKTFDKFIDKITKEWYIIWNNVM